MRLVCADLQPLADEPVAISVVGADPGSVVRIETSRFAGSIELRSWATFAVPERGSLDLATATPLDGTYRHADPRGLWWSVELIGDLSKIEMGPSPTTVSLLDADGAEVDRLTLDRRHLVDGIEPLPVREGGLVGTWFRPLGDGPFPAVVVLSGSEGGDQSTIILAGLLASRGIAALSLAYFAAPTLPEQLSEIPLEYFDDAFAWVLARPEVRGPRVAVAGGSRGGELALLLGSTSEQVGAVVGHVPSGVMWPAIAGLRNRPSWTRAGVGLPYVRFSGPRTVLLVVHALGRVLRRRPIVVAPMFRWFLDHRPELVRAAEIPVERTRGPILLVSGGDDAMWDSTRLADIAVDRAAAHGKHDVTHLRYPAAGHQISVPGAPTLASAAHPVHKATLALGGTPDANDAASSDSWPQVVAFLLEHG